MMIPNFPHTDRIADEKGMITEEWKEYHLQLNTILQRSLSNEGFQNPGLIATDIAKLTASPNGTTLYNLTTNKGMIKEAGTFKTITTS